MRTVKIKTKAKRRQKHTHTYQHIPTRPLANDYISKH